MLGPSKKKGIKKRRIERDFTMFDRLTGLGEVDGETGKLAFAQIEGQFLRQRRSLMLDEAPILIRVQAAGGWARALWHPGSNMPFAGCDRPPTVSSGSSLTQRCFSSKFCVRAADQNNQRARSSVLAASAQLAVQPLKRLRAESHVEHHAEPFGG